MMGCRNATVIVNCHYDIDREALAVALKKAARSAAGAKSRNLYELKACPWRSDIIGRYRCHNQKRRSNGRIELRYASRAFYRWIAVADRRFTIALPRPMNSLDPRNKRYRAADKSLQQARLALQGAQIALADLPRSSISAVTTALQSIDNAAREIDNAAAALDEARMESTED